MTTSQNIYIDLGTTAGVNLTPSIDISNFTIRAQFSKYFYSQQKFSFDVSVNDGIINLNYSGDKSGRYVYDVFGIDNTSLNVYKLYSGDVTIIPNVTTVVIPEELPT